MESSENDRRAEILVGAARLCSRARQWPPCNPVPAQGNALGAIARTTDTCFLANSFFLATFPWIYRVYSFYRSLLHISKWLMSTSPLSTKVRCCQISSLLLRRGAVVRPL